MRVVSLGFPQAFASPGAETFPLLQPSALIPFDAMLLATRWVIKRSNAWMERCKSLVKNFEKTLGHAKREAQSLFYQIDAQTASECIKPIWTLYSKRSP